MIITYWLPNKNYTQHVYVKYLRHNHISLDDKSINIAAIDM